MLPERKLVSNYYTEFFSLAQYCFGANAVQMAAISDLPMDLSQIVNPETGEQMMTV